MICFTLYKAFSRRTECYVFHIVKCDENSNERTNVWTTCRWAMKILIPIENRSRNLFACANNICNCNVKSDHKLRLCSKIQFQLAVFTWNICWFILNLSINISLHNSSSIIRSLHSLRSAVLACNAFCYSSSVSILYVLYRCSFPIVAQNEIRVEYFHRKCQLAKSSRFTNFFETIKPSPPISIVTDVSRFVISFSHCILLSRTAFFLPFSV